MIGEYHNSQSGVALLSIIVVYLLRLYNPRRQMENREEEDEPPLRNSAARESPLVTHLTSVRRLGLKLSGGAQRREQSERRQAAAPSRPFSSAGREVSEVHMKCIQRLAAYVHTYAARLS